MKILVTGAAGYIASHTAERLRSLGHEVVGLDMVGEGGASLTVELEDKKSVPTLVAASTRILLGRGGSKLQHTYTQESAGTFL